MSGDWVVTIPCRNPAMATGLAHHLVKEGICEKKPVAVGDKVYLVYGSDVRLLRAACKAAATGFSHEHQAKAAFLAELKMLPARTKGEGR